MIVRIGVRFGAGGGVSVGMRILPPVDRPA